MPLGIGQYPAEYNAKIHGPYNPATYYGKADTPLGDVKIGELRDWLSRRSYHPISMWRVIHRGYWRWSQKWLMAKNPGFAGVGQAAFAISLFWWMELYNFNKYHRHVKYHW